MIKRLSWGWLLLVVLAGAAHAGVAVGDVPPDRLGRSQEGEDVRLSAYRGKVVVVSFWAEWCPYCRKELPVLAGLQAAAGDQLKVVAVNYKDDRRTYRALLRLIGEVELTMTHDASGRIGEAYGVPALPRLFLIGRDGRIAYQHVGYGEESLQEILDEVNGLLAEPAPKAGEA